MTKIAPKKLETAFVPAGVPTFADLMKQVSAIADLSASRRRDIISGLRRVAKALGRTPEDVPADPRWLQPRINAVAPAAIGLSDKSWSNAVSDARAGLVQCNIVLGRPNRASDLSPAWQRLWAILLLSRDPTLSPALCRFVHFLDRHGVMPQDAANEHAEAYLDALTLNAISQSPVVSYRAAVNGWNLAVRRLPEWPRQTLPLPSCSNRIKFALDCFPQSFRDDLDRYRDSLSHPDPLDEDAIVAPLRPASIAQYQREILRFASVLVHAGIPFEEIVSLEVLVQPAHMEAGLRWLLAKNNNRTAPGISEMAGLLRGVAKQYVRVNEASQKEIDRFAARLAVQPQKGMTSQNRERLRQLEDKTTLRRLLLLPEHLFERAAKMGNTYTAALMREDAVAIAILLYCPIRRQNLATIQRDKNLQHPGDGRVFLVFEPDEVKNSKRIEFELPAQVVDMINRHLTTRAPHLCPSVTPWLFPRRDGQAPISLSQLSDKVKQRIRKETGLTINMHLFRHLAAMLWLEAHPGSYEVARRLLGHSTTSQTINAYAGFEAGTATRLFADVVATARRG